QCQADLGAFSVPPGVQCLQSWVKLERLKVHSVRFGGSEEVLALDKQDGMQEQETNASDECVIHGTLFEVRKLHHDGVDVLVDSSIDSKRITISLAANPVQQRMHSNG